MMKKILFLLAAASLTMTSCMKEDDSFMRLEPIIPGLNIYSGASTQQSIAMLPLDNVMRLAVLLAEGDVQDKAIDELPSMTVAYGTGKTLNVFDQLFPNETTIAMTDEGNYTIELNPERPGAYSGKGTITVNTNGIPLLADTDSDHPWMVTLPSDFKVRMASSYSGTGYQEVVLEGQVSVYKNGLYYQLGVHGMRAYMETSSTIASDWSGSFELVPPADGESLAFSKCMGKKFRFDGSASGPTCVTYNNETGADMFYSIADGIYRNSSLCISGTEKAKLTGYGDYDTAVYPAREVIYLWTLGADERTSLSVTYNGVTVPL